MIVISGIAAPFSTYRDGGWSDPIPFLECIGPDALRGVDLTYTDICLMHDQPQVLARVGAGARLSIDRDALRYSVSLPDSHLGQHVAELVNRGDIRGASISFFAAHGDDTWERGSTRPRRTINKIRYLREVSLVTSPAYPQTTARITVAGNQNGSGAKSHDTTTGGDPVVVARHRLRYLAFRAGQTLGADAVASFNAELDQLKTLIDEAAQAQGSGKTLSAAAVAAIGIALDHLEAFVNTDGERERDRRAAFLASRRYGPGGPA